MKLDSIYITYWSLRDPLCQSQSLPVVRDQARLGRKMALVTYESPAWALDPTARRAAAEALACEGIRWLPLGYHKRPRLFAMPTPARMPQIRTPPVRRESPKGFKCQMRSTLMFAVSSCRREYSFARDRAFEIDRR